MSGLLPRDVPRFTGREHELEVLTSQERGGSVAVVAISGIPGVGKTALAVHAAHRLAPRFPDGQLYTDLHGYTEGQVPAEPGEALEEFLRSLGVASEELPVSVEERSGMLRQQLAARRMLTVLDNAASESQVRPLLPGAGASLVVITSRDALVGLEVDLRIDLGVLPDDQAAALLTRLIGQQRAAAEPDALQQVRDLCGCLPLALRIAGQLLEVHKTWPVARLAGMLADVQHRLDYLSVGDRQVRAAFTVSYQQLPPADARLFRLLGLHPGPDFDVLAAASLAGIEAPEAEQVLARLARVHLIIEEGSDRYGMHDLLRLFARETCFQTEDQKARGTVMRRLVNHFSLLAKSLDVCLDPIHRPEMAQAAAQDGVTIFSLRQALEVFETERQNLLAVLALAARNGGHETVIWLSESMGRALTMLRHLDDLITVRQAALAAARSLKDVTAEATALGYLGNAYRQSRRFDEAVACLPESLSIFRKTGDRHSQGHALNNLGLAYQELRRFDEAITCHREALAIYRETGDRHSESRALTNLGTVYDRLGQFEDALEYFESALVVCHETGDRHGEGVNLADLGAALMGLRRFGEATGCYRDALAIFQETGDRNGEGNALNNLGNAYWKLRRFNEAVSAFQQALLIFRETGDRHSQGRTLANLGGVYDAFRRHKDAIKYGRSASAILQETGDRHSQGQVLSNLAITCQKLRQPHQAASCWRDAAAAMHDAGDHEAATHFEQLAASAQQERRSRFPWRTWLSRLQI